jgi:hypothetical protein
MLLRWFPWKQVVSRLAKSRGLIDPVRVISRLESFGQPLEVKEPLELLRAGLIFHARGLLNTGAIQHNLDWVWPFWVERQYNPHDVSFIPRAFSITHVNLTHRNWTAIGLPDEEQLPIVDPRGLLTPFQDGWSLDFWIVAEDGRALFPSRQEVVEQKLDLAEGMAVVTRAVQDDLKLCTRAWMDEEGGRPVCRLRVIARATGKAWLVASLRPYNPEGVSFIHHIEADGENHGWRFEHNRRVLFDLPAEGLRFSDYRAGDVHTCLFGAEESQEVRCKVGMATAAALFRVEEGECRLQVRIPLEVKPGRHAASLRPSWPEALAGAASASVPDPLFQRLYDEAVRSLILHAPVGEVYPGPYTYKRFWFRDAAFILHALLCIGLTDRVERVLDTFPRRQKASGFFFSQAGEWDSNGEALWILQRFCRLTGRRPKPEWIKAIHRGGRWLQRKRGPNRGEVRYDGLLPPGFSAEHLGPNDYYYWDDFWGVTGLSAAADLLGQEGDEESVVAFRREAEDLLRAIERSLVEATRRLGRPAMPAAPARRLDSGAIGSLAAGYPLQLFAADDPRLLDTADFLHENTLVGGGFFQDVIHSGINPYLTLHLAQVLLRAGDLRATALMKTVAALASPTGQWPEAIHPRTGGGCMGDGHHVWASAEWVMMLRNCFVREEGERLVIGGGIPPEWLEQEKPIRFGPTLTPFGPVEVIIRPGGERVQVSWNARWRSPPEAVEAALPGTDRKVVGSETSAVDLIRKERPEEY